MAIVTSPASRLNEAKMSEPFNACEEKKIEELERALMDRKIPYARMARVYAKFLLALISGENFDRKLTRSSELIAVTRSLQSAIKGFDGGASGDLRQPHRVELIGISGRVEESQPALAALIRCAVCCFFVDEEWDPDLEEDSTPIPRYLFLLKKFDSSMEMEFLTYASTYLLSA